MICNRNSSKAKPVEKKSDDVEEKKAEEKSEEKSEEAKEDDEDAKLIRKKEQKVASVGGSKLCFTKNNFKTLKWLIVCFLLQ